MTDAEFAADYSKRSLQEDSNGEFFYRFIAVAFALFALKVAVDIISCSSCGG